MNKPINGVYREATISEFCDLLFAHKIIKKDKIIKVGGKRYDQYHITICVQPHYKQRV